VDDGECEGGKDGPPDGELLGKFDGRWAGASDVKLKESPLTGSGQAPEGGAVIDLVGTTVG